jgi:hypothetical protein
MARFMRAIHTVRGLWMARTVGSDSVPTGHDEWKRKKAPEIPAPFFYL